LSLRAIVLKSLDFLIKVKSFALIIFKISYLRCLIINALNISGRFKSRVLEEEE
jgi:hypothetical protein